MTYETSNNSYATTTEQNSESSRGKKLAGVAIGAVVVAAVAAAGLYMVDLDQTQEARLPTVHVNVEEGQLPKYDVEVADVSLGEKKVDVEMPTMNVETETKTIEVEVPVEVEAEMETETVTVPTLDIDRPTEDNPADNPSN